RRLAGDILMLAARGQLAVGEQGLERDPAAGDAALDRADGAAANLRRFLIGEAAGADEDQGLALRLRQMEKRALHVAELDVPILAGGRSEQFGRSDLVPLALEAGAAHLAQEQVPEDDEGPRAHV